MMRRGVRLLPVLLIGCATASPGDSPEAVCRRQAYDDPAVKNLMIVNTTAAGPQTTFDLNLALREATQNCLRQKGVAVRGGVEPVRPH